MGNKLKYIKLANLLLEKRYLSEQTTTGTTQPISGSTTPISGTTKSPQIQQTSNTPETSQKQTTELNKIKQMSPDDVKKKYVMCKGVVGDPIEDEKISKWGFKVHKFGDTFCIG